MSAVTEYFSMQGKVSIGKRNADGSRAPARWVSDASTLEWAMSVDQQEANESWSGVRGLAATLTTKRSMQVNLTLRQLNDDNAALAMDGDTVAVASGSATGEVIGDVAAGNVVALEFAKVSAVVLTDGSAATLVAGTDYTLNADTGVVTFLTAKTGVTAAYTYAAFSIVTALAKVPDDWYVLFDGLNTVDGATGKVRGEVHRISFNPASNLAWISDNFGEMQLQGKAKIDPVRQADPQWGGYARVILI